MSAVSGLTSKGENKSKQKYQSLNINNLYKGKSLENPKTSVVPKHGLQTLGKVGAGRRMPPPANLPSLKSQSSGNPIITLVPTGGQGWGSGKEEDSGATPPLQTSSSGQLQQEISQVSQKIIANQPNQSIHPSTDTIDSSVGAIASAAALTAASKTWSTITAIPSEECGPDKSYLAQQSPFFPQEFPKLIGGSVLTDDSLKANIETYGPGPSLRPQTEGSWGRGTLPQAGGSQPGSQPVNPGNGGSGQSPPVLNEQNVQNLQQIARGLYPQQVGGIQQRPPIPGSVPIMTTSNQVGGPLIPGQPGLNALQYRMMYQNMYPRGGYPISPFPQGYPHPPQANVQSGRPYYPDARIRQKLDDNSGVRQTGPAALIITDQDLKGFDEILDNDIPATWATANHEIDYNAKLVFSDDEEMGADRDRESNHSEQRERREDREGEPNKYRSQQQWQQQQHPNNRPSNYDYGQTQPPGQTSGPPYQRSQQMHGNYPQSRHNRSEMVDDEEMWKQRSRQQSDEMAAAVIRARQRREEEEKKIERSRQAAHEKLKALEEKAVSADKDSRDFDECSRHSSESRDDKQSVRDNKDMRAVNYTNAAFPAPKQYTKNVPPRFLKQAELMRQQSGQTAQSPPYDQRQSHSNRLPQDIEQRPTVANQVSNANTVSNKPLGENSRSDSQISSGRESYDSEREIKTPEYESHSKEKKPQKQQSGFDNNNWRSTQRLSVNEPKDSMRVESYDSEKSNQHSQQISKRTNDDTNQLNSKSDQNLMTKNRQELKDFKVRDDIDREVERRHPFERQESSQSSQSDKRSTSSKDEKLSKRLDWASECDNMSISSYGKRDRHRHVPITQKQFESIEPIRKNFTPLKKISSSTATQIIDETKDNSFDKNKDNRKPIPVNQTLASVENANQTTKPVNTDVTQISKLKSEPIVEVPKRDRDIDRHYDRGYKEKDSSKKDPFKEDKNSRKNNSNRFDSYQNRGRYAASSYRGGRGREYRRSRNSSEKSSYNDSKLSSSPGNSKNKNKTRRKSISDESFVSEDQNKKETIKLENDKSVSVATKDAKHDDERDKDKLLSSEQNISTSVASSVLPNQRGDISRRGRGAVAFKTSTRGLPRSYGPSNYGPPPFRAAFGDGAFKSDSNKNLDQSRNERNNDSRNSNDSNQMRVNSSKSYKDDMYFTSYSNQSNRGSNDSQRSSGSHNRKNVISNNRGSQSNAISTAGNRSEQLPPRFQKRNPNGRGGRTRNWNERSGSSNANQVESDVTNNEEWETASESSDIADRGDRKSSKKSNYSDQRNDRNYNRKPDNKRSDYPRSQNSSGGHPSSYRGRHRNPGSNSVPTNRNSNSTNLSLNQHRNGSLNNNSNIVNNDNITVCSLTEVTLDNPNAIDEALNDIKSRGKATADDQFDSETEDGFQTVSYKKRNRANQGNNSKKLKQEIKTTVRNRQLKLAPRFAKQKETNRLSTTSIDGFTKTNADISEEIKNLSIDSKFTDNKISKDRIETSNRNTVNAWSKPLSHSSQTPATNLAITTSTKTIVKTTNSISHDIQALSVSSKSSSFDQHDSGIDISDQPQSTASSQRSSPSNDDNKPITTTAKTTTTATIECKADIVSDIDTGKPMGTYVFENTRFKEENKVLAKIAPAKSPSAKEMFTINNTTVSNVVTETSRTLQDVSTPKKNDSVLLEEFPSAEKNQSPNVAKVVGMQRSNVLPTDELNMKIASVKKVWENSPSVTPVIEKTNESPKNVLINSFDENKIKTSISQSNDNLSSVKVNKSYQSNQSTIKSDYSSVESMNALNKVKQGMSYTNSSPVNSQSHVSQLQSQPSIISSQQLILNPLNSPPLDSIRSIPGVQTTFQVHNMAASPAISSPPTMMYNTQVAAHNVYQAFGQQLESLHQNQMPVLTQFNPQQSAHYGQQHQHQHLQHLQHQQNSLNQANVFLAAHQLAQSSQQSTADQIKFNTLQAAHQQNLANFGQSLVKSQFVHQNSSTLQHTLQNSWTTASGHTQGNTQTANYYPQSSSVGSGLQPHQHQFAYQSQHSIGLMAGQPSQQAMVQQSYRATPLSIARSTGVDAANPMAANLRTMFSGNMSLNDLKIGTSVHQAMDNRNANNRTSFTYSQSNIQQLQQQQLFANHQKFANRAILPIYQQMMGQSLNRSNTAPAMNTNSMTNSYTTPIQRPKINRNNQSYPKSSHQTHHQQHQQQTNATQLQTQQLTTAQQAKMRQEAVLQTQSFFAQSAVPQSKSEQISQTADISNTASTKDCVAKDSSAKDNCEENNKSINSEEKN